MNSNLETKTHAHLTELLSQCGETIGGVFDRLEHDGQMVEGMQQLLVAEDLVDKFEELVTDNRHNAEMILRAAIAVLVNTHSMQAIDVELKRRSREAN